jgi:hypothetical protein
MYLFIILSKGQRGFRGFKGERGERKMCYLMLYSFLE